MAERIRYNSEIMRSAAGRIRGTIDQYASAASSFTSRFETATAEWEGASKDRTILFVEGPVNKYLTDTVPQLLEALASLLEANAQQMEEADAELAKNIPDSLG